MMMIISLVGCVASVIGIFIGYAGAIHIQNRGFRKEEKTRKRTFICLNQILQDDLKNYYQILFTGDNSYYCMDFNSVIVYYKDFNFSNYWVILPELIKHKEYVENKEIFRSISKVIQSLDNLNQHIALVRPHRLDLTGKHISVTEIKHMMDEIRTHYQAGSHTDNIDFEKSGLNQKLLEIIIRG